MAPRPGSTFTVHASNHDRLFPDETWLSGDPGTTASRMSDCRDDQAFGYYIHVEKSRPKDEPLTTYTYSRAGARALFNDLAITSSGIEEHSDTTSISANSSRLLTELLDIIDAYLANDPGRALLAQRKLLAPKLENHILVDQGMEEVPFNWSYERKTLHLTEVLIELGQAACRWRGAELEKTGSEFKTPLPCSPSSKILIVSRPRAKDLRLAASRAIVEAAELADADYYVTLGSEIVATIESKPHCSAQDTGKLVRTRNDPFGQREGQGIFTGPETLKLLFQLCSQPVAAACQSGLLVGDWGRLMLPYEVRRSNTDPGQARLVFASVGSYCDVLDGEQASTAASEQSRAGLAGQDSPSFRFDHLPNTVFFLLGWILQVVHGLQESPSHVQEGEAEAKPAATESDDNDREDPGPPAKRPRQDPKGATAFRSSAMASTSSEGARDNLDSPTNPLPLITDYVCSSGPIFGGTFAALHWCVVQRSHLAGRTPSGERKGRPALGLLPRLGPGDCHTILKVQRIPSMPDPDASLPEARFEGPDEPTPSDEDRQGIRERTAQEISIFEHCKDLQGVTIPRLYGLVAPEDYPQSSAHKLMLQDLSAHTIASVERLWRHLWGDDLVRAVRTAYTQLHARRVCHVDVSNSNILVEWRKIASIDSIFTSSSVPETLESWTLRDLVEDVQKQMQLDDKAFLALARSLGERGVIDSEGDSGLTLEAPASQSPLDHLRTAVKPHVWLVDFADSVIVGDGKVGDSLLASEDLKVEQTLERWRK
ncbi:hypothetical protein BCV69DRAFT_282527 [Microstroma glucosiphilum]|uniref:Uncharacterized protein n=1 Tax=Pseudomicrostroma glucosiphilum TaxID=1684307 RepID=A0A316U851_9BASI|nr:hypothetical protein BCV69DRAFT_282527 [Pseudomicrostroma glucosiphilum]PWN21024.1 hypothetical protein BCV69DRAFT_282527 [Pseudomicrostroma glucosiphilum]